MTKLRDVMTQDIQTVGPEASLQEAARRMREEDVGSLPVTHDGKPVGIVTDRDITIRATAEGRDPGSTQVREVMSGDVACCREDESIEAAAELMERRQVRRLMVLDRDGRLCGIVSLGDLAVRTNADEISEEVLEEVSRPGHRRLHA